MLYTKSNRLLRLFYHCSTDVKIALFRSYCTCFYCPFLWTHYKKSTHSKLSVTNTAFELMKNYLSDRKQYIKYNVHESDVMAIKRGVPQGSILGPLLFSIICINDLVTVSNKLNFFMYADDTTIYFNLEDFSRDDVVNCVSIELNKVNNWLHENKLSLNIEKNKMYDFSSTSEED